MIRHKFNAIQTIRDGHKFPSKKEAFYYDHLVMAQRVGAVLFFLRQVPFHLPGNIKYTVDFQVFYRNGDIRFIDVKGFQTKDFKRNKKQVEALYPVEIEVI